jgi:hypothetical protein
MSARHYFLRLMTLCLLCISVPVMACTVMTLKTPAGCFVARNFDWTNTQGVVMGNSQDLARVSRGLTKQAKITRWRSRLAYLNGRLPIVKGKQLRRRKSLVLDPTCRHNTTVFCLVCGQKKGVFGCAQGVGMKIISGGQAGVDRAALDAAIDLGLAQGGWCPKGRLAEDGVISDRYSLLETDSADVSVRTIRNIKTADATLILVPSLPLTVTDGTVLTIEKVKALHKPYLILNLSKALQLKTVSQWFEKYHVVILNVAGPRESQSPGIYKKSKAILITIFSALKALS